ncbi:MAG: AAA family ATPase, partial [Gammaproteobacteria bacterium]|nr:AAA family ATPase [Gammaproteobacteria bacterium]
MMIGRESELAELRSCIDSDGPMVMMIHGLGGVGKTTLLQAFARDLSQQDTQAVYLDCRHLEPTEAGFLGGVFSALNVDVDGVTVRRDVSGLSALLKEQKRLVVLMLDHYEVFRLMDTWLRQIFLPAVTDCVRIVLADRQPPLRQWLTDPWLGDRFRACELGTLDALEAGKLLAQMGVDDSAARNIIYFSHGHPLALRVAGLAAIGSTELDSPRAPLDRVVSELTRFYLADVDDSNLRSAIEAAALVRRINVPMLATMTGLPEAERLYDRLGALHFIEHRGDGLSMHEAIRDAIAGALRARDPGLFRAMRRSAWRQVRAEIATAPTADMWRCTADMIYLIENPVVREAFFPSSVRELAVEPASHSDQMEIMEITAKHDPPAGVAAMAWWWSQSPDSFHVVRNSHDNIVGFYLCLHANSFTEGVFNEDPIACNWLLDLKRLSTGGDRRALFLRRWLSRDEGEFPSKVQAACWLDAKRSYMALRPDLDHVYLTVSDLTPYASAASQLGFRPLADSVTLNNVAFASARLDFGPGSVDGWIAGILSTELGLDSGLSGNLLDVAARQLLTHEGPVDLTPLEFGVMRLLTAYPG